MKFIPTLGLSLSLLFSQSYKSYENDILHLNNKQKQVMKKIYTKSSPFNLGLTMVAISYKESKLGKYMLNLSDPSCGVFMVMPSTLVTNGNTWDKSRYCERLIKDTDFSVTTALERFKYFYNYWRSKGYNINQSWRRAVISYNSGFYVENKTYLKEFLKIFRVLLTHKKELFQSK